MRTFKINNTPFTGIFESVEVERKDGKKILCLTGVPHSEKNSDGSVKVLPVDQFSGRSFMLNCYGHPMNDIMAFETAQSDDIARQVLQRIQVLPKSDGDGLTLEQRFESIVPETWSSPAEYVRMQTKFAELAIKYQQNQEDQKPYHRTKSDETDENSVTVDPE